MHLYSAIYTKHSPKRSDFGPKKQLVKFRKTAIFINKGMQKELYNMFQKKKHPLILLAIS